MVVVDGEKHYSSDDYRNEKEKRETATGLFFGGELISKDMNNCLCKRTRVCVCARMRPMCLL